MKRATIIRRSLVGLVCTVGVGALYLAPSLAGPPEQIAIPAPTELPTMEPTPFESPTDMPTPFESTTPEPFPTDTTVSTAPTTTYPTTETTTAPPYVPPKTSKPEKTKTTKPPKIELGAVTVTISDLTSKGFTAEWTAVSNSKGYTVTGCGSTKTTKSKNIDRTFKTFEKCSLKVTAQGSGSYKDGPTTTTAVLPKLDMPDPKAAPMEPASENSFMLTWASIPGAATYEIDSGAQCTGAAEVLASSNPSAKMTFNLTTVNICTIKIRAVSSKGKYVTSEYKSINVDREDLKKAPVQEPI